MDAKIRRDSGGSCWGSKGDGGGEREGRGVTLAFTAFLVRILCLSMKNYGISRNEHDLESMSLWWGQMTVDTISRWRKGVFGRIGKRKKGT